MRFKRKGIGFLCVCVLSSTLSGCMNWQRNSQTDTITIWSPDAHSKSVVEQIVNQFNQTTGKEKGIWIDYQIKPANTIQTELEAAIENGGGPDIFATGDFIPYENKGYLTAIDDLPGGAELIAELEEQGGRTYHCYKDKYWSISTTTTTQGLIYNKEMFEKAGIVDENGEADPPETLEEMREAAKKLTNPKKMEYGMILPLGWTDWAGSDIVHMSQVNVGYSGFNVANGTYDYTGMADVVNTYMQMKEDGSLYPGCEKTDNDQARALFAAGGIGMKIGHSFDVGVLNIQFPADFEWGVAPLPVKDPENCYMQGMDAGGGMYINSNATKHVVGEKLVEVIKFFCSDEYIRQTYKKGVYLPQDWTIVEDIEPEENLYGWKEFCEMIKISVYNQCGPIGGTNDELTQRFAENVWTGKQTAEEMLLEHTLEVQELLRQYENNPENPSVAESVQADWDIRRK